MGQNNADGEPLGAVVVRLPFAVQTAKRFVLMVFGGLTVMVSVWATTMLNSAVFAVPDESRRLFVVILGLFTVIIVVGFTLTWWFLRRYPRALVVHERVVVLEHGARSRTVRLTDVAGIDQRTTEGSSTFVLLVTDGTEIPFGQGRDADAVATVIVNHAGLEWLERPLKARRAGTSGPL